MRIGVLSIQGAVGPHLKKLKELHADVAEVRNPHELRHCDALILPGGESSAMIHIAKQNGLWEALQTFVTHKPTWGICAGAILLAKEVSHPAQDSLGALDIGIERNAFGRQVDSFIDKIDCANGQRVEGFFIRAPRIKRVGAGAEVRGTWQGEPVFVEQGLARVTTFHPELTDENTLHQNFLEKCQAHGRTLT